MVEVKGARTLQASCVRPVRGGHGGEHRLAASSSAAGRCLTELLLADHPSPARGRAPRGDCDLEALGRRYGLLAGGAPAGAPRTAAQVLGRGCRYAPGPARAPKDRSSPVIAVDHQACILCDRCIRACDDVQVNDVIGRTGKGYTARIAFDLDDGRWARVHLRGVRRVRRRLPDRRARRTSRSLAPDPAAQPTLKQRRLASAPTAAWAARSPTTSTRREPRGAAPTGREQPGQRRSACA